MTDTNDSSLTSASTAPSDPPSSAPSPTTAGATPPPAAAFAQARATRPQIVGSEGPERPYPIYLRGEVERGFGRGGKELGCATGEYGDDSQGCKEGVREKCGEPGSCEFEALEHRLDKVSETVLIVLINAVRDRLPFPC